MNVAAETPNPVNLRSDRRIYVRAALAVATAVVYGSLVPFDLRRPETFNLGRWLALLRFAPWSTVSLTDLIVNMAVGMPLGFVLMGTLRTGRPRNPAGVAIALPVVGFTSALLSGAVELLQLLSPTRQASWNDVLAQTVGATIGALMWTLSGRAVGRSLRATANEPTSSGLAARLLQLYLPIYLLLQLTPFDASRAADLAMKYKEGQGVILLSTIAVDSSFVRLLNAAGNALLAVPLGALAVLGWVNRGTERTVGWALLLGVSLILTVGIAQEVIGYHVRVSELLVSTLGVAFGIASARFLPSVRIKPSDQSRLVHPWLLMTAGIWTLVLLAHSWYPFDFALTSEIVRQRLTRMSVVPFVFYYWYASYVVSPLQAVHEALLQFLLAVPLGLLLRLAWRVAGERRVRRLQGAAILASATMVLLAIELGQAFLPMRFPDVTDALMGAIGAMVGIATVTALACRQA